MTAGPSLEGDFKEMLRGLAEAGGEIGYLMSQGGSFTLKVAEEGKERGLGSSWNQIPKILGNGRML